MKVFSVKNAVIASAIGMFGIVGSASAQNRNEEYREWQRAQRQAQEELRDYQRSGSRSDYRDWQQAQRRAQQEQREYIRSTRNGNIYNNGNGVGYGYGRANRAGVYRVYRNGSYYETNQRGAELLKQAVNSGYQQGFQRGYEDGYNSRTQYGYRNGNSYNILGTILNGILQFSN